MSQADLEISLFHRSANDYGVTLRFRRPAAGQDKSASGSFALDEAALRQRQHDPAAYGELLAAQLFGSPDLRRFLDQALAVAASQQTPLHLRLFIHPDAEALHALRWETLRLPGSAAPLAVGEWLRFSRYLDSAGWRPARTAQRDALRALVAVASPDVGGTTLAEVRTEDELAAARTGLGDIPFAALAGRGQGTLANLLARLRDGCDILYLVAHGMVVDGEPQILLEREDGGRAWTSGRELAVRLGELAQPPSLVVLVSCQSAGSGDAEPSTHDDGALAGLGPRLAAAGVPAVVAMQGNLTMATAAAFMPVFLRELRRDGVVDRAVAVARGAVRARADWWMPVLYTRLEDGRVFDLAAMLPPPPCPYPGMVPFRAEDARFFYGREDEIQQMMDHLRHQRLLLVIGPSGSGKSSLIAAGLLPRLEKSTYFAPGFWLVRTMRPLDHPVAALAACLEGDVSQPEQAVAALLAAHAPAQRLLLVIDQFEETFSLADKAERQQFMAALQVLRRSQQCALAIALRADFYPDLMNCELWPVDPGQRLEVAVLRGAALRQAIRQPATDVEVEIDEALIERLLADAAGEPGALPMLQETLVLLWERMRRRQITLGDYEQLGEGERSGLAVAVARKADATVAELTPAEQLIAQRIFLRLIQFGEGRRDTRRQLPAADLRSAADDDQAFERTLEHLARNRLLTTSGEEGGGRRVDIAHEALITGWPRLQVWLRERKEAESTRRRLEEKAKEWVRLGRGEGGLLDKTELAEAEAWLASSEARTVGISDDLRHLVEYSRKTINPGWHLLGTTAMFLGLFSIAALVSWLYVFMRSLQTEPITQVAIWLLVGGLALGALVTIVVLLRSDSFVIQRLSHTVGTRRKALGVSLVLMATSVMAWGFVGLQILSALSTCADLGFRTDRPATNVAIVNKGVGALGAKLFELRLANLSIPPLLAREVTSDEARRCQSYLGYTIELSRTPSDQVEQTAYIAAIENHLSRTPLEPEKAIGKEECQQLEFLAARALRAMNHLSSGDQIYDTVDLPAPKDCETYVANEDGYRLFKNGDFREAEAMLRRAIDRYPEYAMAHNNLGWTLYAQSAVEESIMEFATAITLTKPTVFGPFEQGLVNACLAARDYRCAEQAALKLVNLHRDLDHLHQLSVIYRDWGREDPLKYENANEVFSVIDAFSTQNTDNKQRRIQELWLAKNRGILAFFQGKLQDAKTLLEQADAPELAMFEEEVVYYLAIIAGQQGDNVDACRLWQRYQTVATSQSESLPDLIRQERRRDGSEKLKDMNCTQ